MTEPMCGQRSMTCWWVIIGLVGFAFFVAEADAKSSSASSSSAAKTAACDYRSLPTITMVTPNHVKPGQKITISGKNFGTKNCFHSVSFGPKSTDAWTYVNPTTVEATVPNLHPGSVPVTVSTEAGTSQFKLEIQAK
jgi:hypothetical protein